MRETIQQRETEYENGLSINDNALQWNKNTTIYICKISKFNIGMKGDYANYLFWFNVITEGLKL